MRSTTNGCWRIFRRRLMTLVCVVWTLSNANNCLIVSYVLPARHLMIRSPGRWKMFRIRQGTSRRCRTGVVQTTSLVQLLWPETCSTNTSLCLTRCLRFNRFSHTHKTRPQETPRHPDAVGEHIRRVHCDDDVVPGESLLGWLLNNVFLILALT